MTHVIGDCHLFRKTGSLADLKHKEKEQMGRFGEIEEKISREEYTLDWSQSKVFLVVHAVALHLYQPCRTSLHLK